MILVLDPSVLKSKDRPSSHIYTTPLAIKGHGWLDFYVDNLYASTSVDFVRGYIDYSRNGVKKPYMEKLFRISEVASMGDPVTCDKHVSYELRLAKDSSKFWKEMLPKIRAAERKTYSEVLDTITLRNLVMINNTFVKYGTRVEVVVAPVYNEKGISGKLPAFLNLLFGREHVHDFSNDDSYTKDPRNFYDPNHFRSACGARMLRSVYQ